MPESYNYVIVGAGLAGLVMAERLSSVGHSCLIIDRRNHIGGIAYDQRDRNGLFYHPYGAHYFRTDSAVVRDYLSRFTKWREVVYKVQSFTQDKYWSLPINLATFRQLTDSPGVTQEQFEAYLKKNRVPIVRPANAEEVFLSAVGHELNDLLLNDYTLKQWGRSGSQLDAAIGRRMAVRTILDDRYFPHSFQALPRMGYTAMFEAMLEGTRAELRLGTEYRELLPHLRYNHLIYTGALDEYFGCEWGRLPYRTLKVDIEEINADRNPTGFIQPALQINYPGHEPFTRTVELKHVTGQNSPCTNIAREFPAEYKPSVSEPFYPIPGDESHDLAQRYRDLAAQEQNVTFVGRLATYRYLEMDDVVASALQVFERIQRGNAPTTSLRIRGGLGKPPVR